MKFLVLGGGGFIGAAVVDRLLMEKQSVRVFDKVGIVPYRIFDSHEDIDWVVGDFVNVEDVKRSLEGVDIVIHLVSTVLPKSSNLNPLYDIESNLMGTVAMLTAAVAAGVKKIIFASSGGTVYGKPVHLPIKENHSTTPICSYGVVKLAVEQYLGVFDRLHGLDYTVLRLSNPFGEGQKTNAGQGAVAVFLDKALKGETIEIWGDGSIVRDYLHVSDVANAMVAATHYCGRGEVINIGSGEGRSLNQLLDVIEQVTERKLNIRYLEGRPFDVPVNVLAIDKAKNLLGWQPQLTFSEGLKRMADWMRSRPENKIVKIG